MALFFICNPTTHKNKTKIPFRYFTTDFFFSFFSLLFWLSFLIIVHVFMFSHCAWRKRGKKKTKKNCCIYVYGTVGYMVSSTIKATVFSMSSASLIKMVVYFATTSWYESHVHVDDFTLFFFSLLIGVICFATLYIYFVLFIIIIIIIIVDVGVGVIFSYYPLGIIMLMFIFCR